MPDRRWTLDGPVELNMVQWGSDDDRPVLVAHGGGDFIRSFDVFGPLLAGAGLRVIGWDHRGHGDSARAEMYGWSGDLADAEAVVSSVVEEVGAPVPVVAHSKSGVLSIELASLRPDLISTVVAIDGFCRRRSPSVPVPDAAEAWFDRRRSIPDWKPSPLETMSRRRHRINYRLPMEWMRYLVTVGADEVGGPGSDQWVWKLDPGALGVQPHPWSESLSLELLSTVTVPVLALVAGDREEFVSQPDPERLLAHLPAGSRMHVLGGLGHFAHVEAPDVVADLVADWL